MAGITRKERERRQRAALESGEIDAASTATLKAYQAAIDERNIAASEAETVITEVWPTTGTTHAKSRHWPGLTYKTIDPEPEQDPLLGTKDPVWFAWFERQGGKLK